MRLSAGLVEALDAAASLRALIDILTEDAGFTLLVLSRALVLGGLACALGLVLDCLTVLALAIARNLFANWVVISRTAVTRIN